MLYFRTLVQRLEDRLERAVFEHEITPWSSVVVIRRIAQNLD